MKGHWFCKLILKKETLKSFCSGLIKLYITLFTWSTLYHQTRANWAQLLKILQNVKWELHSVISPPCRYWCLWRARAGALTRYNVNDTIKLWQRREPPSGCDSFLRSGCVSCYLPFAFRQCFVLFLYITWHKKIRKGSRDIIKLSVISQLLF